MLGGVLNHINVKTITAGSWKENCYIVSNVAGEVLIIDPGHDRRATVRYIEANDYQVSAIVNTHAHYDHVGAVQYLKDRYQAPFYLHSLDEQLLRSANLYAKIFNGTGPIQVPAIDHYLDRLDIQTDLPHFDISMMLTPGHTRGSVCILIENCLFTGDTLLRGSVGRTDLPGGDRESLCESLTALTQVPPQTNIYPGHGAASTIEHEVTHNRALSQAIR